MKRLAALAFVALAVPAAAPAASVEQGLHLYGRYCVMCHGPNGSGVQKAAASRVGGGPARDQVVQAGAGPSLRGVGAQAAHFYLTTGYMPLRKLGEQPRRARLLLTPDQIDSLIAYVASLGGGPPVPTPHPERGNLSRGQHLFTVHCAGCHQALARGGYVTGAIPPPLGDATPTQIAEAVRIGPFLRPRFSERALSNRELDSIIRYVEYAKNPEDPGGWAIGHVGPVPEGLVTWFIAAAALVGMCVLLSKRLSS